jgi:hypothetical protein
MRIPFKIRLFNKFVKRPRYIIIHDVSCQVADAAELRIDNEKFQTNELRTREYTEVMQPDLNYHFIVEKIKTDYEVLLGRPFAVHCEYDDIINPYNFAFHICVMGNYDYDIPDRRMYQKIAYSILAPLMRTFKIPPPRILLHSEISTNKELNCPGTFFDKKLLISYMKNLRIV